LCGSTALRRLVEPSSRLRSVVSGCRTGQSGAVELSHPKPGAPARVRIHLDDDFGGHAVAIWLTVRQGDHPSKGDSIDREALSPG
jgi:hypothetical protein